MSFYKTVNLIYTSQSNNKIGSVMVKIVFAILIVNCLQFTSQVYAAKTAETIPPATLNQVMSEIGKVMVDLYPLIVARRNINDMEKFEMEQSVAQLIVLFKLAKPFIIQKSEPYQFSYDYILDYLQETKQAFEKENYRYARSNLYTLGTICSSCHTQDARLRTLFSGTNRSHFQDDYSYAEFNFSTRHYDEAIKYYNKHLNADDMKTELDIVRPLQRIITVYTQVLNKPGEGAKQLRKYLDLKSHSRTTKEHLAQWILGLDDLQSSGASKVKNIDFQTLENYVKEYFGDLNDLLPGVMSTPRQEVSRVWLRGVLYKYLNGHPENDEIPKIIYWLALCDRSIDYNYYFSLSDLYLKQCVVKHPHHPYAKRCFNEYREYVTFSYTGSAGTFIPPDVQQQLDELQNLLK